MNCLAASLVGLDELGTASLYFFKYYWPDRVSGIREALYSTARNFFSSSKSIKEATPISASLKEAYTTSQEDAFTLPLDFLLVTVVPYWL